MFRYLVLPTLTTTLLLTSSAFAHSEHDKARFVSETGQDVGQCENVLRPCKTIGYAVKQANKGDKVLVASGTYKIASADELFYLNNALVPVKGGYNRFDHFQSQSPNVNITRLSNVPDSMTSQLRSQGFNIISDGKAFENDDQFNALLAKHAKLSERQTNVECVNGIADTFTCNNIDLLAHVPLNEFSSNPSGGSDIWGHVDLNSGDEYAIMTTNNGVTIFNISEPTAPVEVGTISGVNSGWRDVKVYQYFDDTIGLWQAYAYVTTEGNKQLSLTDYVTIVDLNSLPHSISKVENNRVVSTAHNIYISNVDHTLNIALPNREPSLQLVGANTNLGAFQSYSLNTPRTLVANSGSYFGDGYTHDGSSISINDQRAITGCNESSSECTVFIDFNEKEMKLWNITDPQQTTLLGTAEYNDVSKSNQYVHSGWSTEDQQYVLLHDEFDEYRGGLNSTVRIFSINDLKNPVQVGQWTGPTTAIDHNGYVRGNRYYMSNYTRGLTILDISDPSSPQEVGFFDTFPANDEPSFNGAWGVYPYLPSGNIIVSDINSGLYIVKDNTKDTINGQIGFASTSVETEQDATLNISVQRENVAENAAATSVQYQVISGSATNNEDFVLENGTLTWQENDVSNKEIVISIAPDESGQEAPESFFIRLHNPQNGVVLSENNYITVNIAGVIDQGSVSFEAPTFITAENQTSININVNRLGSIEGEVSVDYQTVSGTAVADEDFDSASGRLTWSDGDNASKTITLFIVDDEIEEVEENFTVLLTSVDGSKLGSHPELTITLSDDDTNTAPTVSLGEDFEVNTNQSVTLTAQASDAEQDALTYLWTQSAGESVSISDETTINATFTAPSSAGTLTFEFSATDSKGAITSESITITVVAPTQTTPPTTNQPSSGGGGASWLLILLSIIGIGRRYQLK
ncbi:choice-of-anchor B family protein [Thalassotalea ganghwensis]